MARKPAHLTPENAARFQDQSVVDLYHLRLPYPPEIFDVLAGLIVDEPRTVLDVGTGTGEIARALAGRVDRVDAVDISAPMIARGKARPGGDHPQLRWIMGQIESVALDPPYALITAGDSMHWMDWEVVFPRFATLRSKNGLVALVHRDEIAPPWRDDLTALIDRYSTIRDYQPFDLIAELEQRHLFRVVGRHETAPIAARQPVDEYIASCHSRSALSLDRMPAADAAAFDRLLRDLVARWSVANMLEMQTVGSVIWGTPQG